MPGSAHAGETLAAPFADVAGDRTQDLHAWLADYEREHSGDVLRVDDPLSADQDISAIVVELARRSDEPPIVACSNVEGIPVPVVTNVFASRDRIARLLGCERSELHRVFDSASVPVAMKVVDSGPVTDVSVQDGNVDVAAVPMLRHFEQDRAPYLTSAIVVAEDPRTGIGNASYHRCMIASPTSLATSLHSRGHLWRYLQAAKEMGKELPVAVVIGGHPLFMLASAARVPVDVDEREIAGGLFGSGLEVVPTPEYGIAVPASSDYVLEGTIDPSKHEAEGPFGEYSGYASARSTNNVIDVTAILHREDPWLLDIVSGNAADHLNLGRVPRESEMTQKLWARFPDVIDVEYPASGTHFHCYVSVRPGGVPQQARQVAVALLGWDPYLKLVVVVDDDVDVRREQEVLWAVATRFQATTDLVVIPEMPGSLLDPSSRSGVTARMVVDATRGEGFDGDRITLSHTAVERAHAVLDRLDHRTGPS